ncbi:MAG: antibiotic biosynthesis monooxygenase [Actinomycetota bacterium]
MSNHFRVALYDVTSGTAQESVEIARTQMIPLYQAQPGFVRYEVGILDTGGICSFSIWETAAEAHVAAAIAHEFVMENLANRLQLREEHTGDMSWDETP